MRQETNRRERADKRKEVLKKEKGKDKRLLKESRNSFRKDFLESTERET
jgi:hypothetical protein